MNYREKMKEYLKEPDEHSSQYGKWGALNREQRTLIKRLLNEMDNADIVIKNQFEEIEKLNQYIDFYKDLDEKQNKELQNLKQVNEEHQRINGDLRVENDRLNNRVKQLEKSIMISNKKHSFMAKDNIKLRTIINELEKEFEEELKNLNYSEDKIYAQGIHDTIISHKYKLQELKGENNDKENN